MNTLPAADPPAQPYVAYQTRTPIQIDGRLTERAWQLARTSPRFVDVVSGAPALYETRAAILWDSIALYTGFWIEEPLIQARQTERDALVFLDNDVEVFIDGGDTYYEFEINALGTIYEVFFIWQDAYRRGGRFDVPEFDLLSRRALSFGGNHDRTGRYFWRGSHPRGPRWAFLDWDFPGLQTAVQGPTNFTLDGVSRSGWTVELAFPWSGMAWLANGRSLPPQNGDLWRLFVGRYEQVHASGQDHTVGWAWHPIGSTDNHVPERFTPIQFSTSYVENLA
jgi:transposase